MMNTVSQQLRESFFSGLKKGISSFGKKLKGLFGK